MAASTGKRSRATTEAEDEVVVFMDRSDAHSCTYDEWLIVRYADFAPEDIDVIMKYVQLVRARNDVPEAGELEEPGADTHDEAVYGPWLAMRDAHLLYHTLRLVFNGNAADCVDDDLRWKAIRDYAHHAGLDEDDPSFKLVVATRCAEFARRVQQFTPHRDEMRDRAIDISNVIVRYTVPMVMND